MTRPQLKIATVPTADLVPYVGNAKEHPEWQVEQIAESISEFGMCDPVGVWHDSGGAPIIVEGHGRVLALKLLGIEECPTIALDHLTDEERRAYVHVHNQTTMNSGFDLSVLEREMESLPEFDWDALGFGETSDWFGREHGGNAHQDGNDEYNAFVDKFEPKRTSDDCYTPTAVYDAVADWVSGKYGVDRGRFVRPFYPGGDYQAEEYRDGDVVVDNPPFSILGAIIRFYMGEGVPFFLFAPTLTLFTSDDPRLCYIPTKCNITHENGAKISTSFVTNMDDSTAIMTAPDLTRAVMAADAAGRPKPLPKYDYPSHVVTSAMVANWGNAGVEFSVPRGACVRISALDAQKAMGKAVFGHGFLLSDESAANAEKAAAEAVSEDRRERVAWSLSERELGIVRGLG